MEFLFVPQNLPFAVALVVMIGIAALEGAFTLIGLGFSQLLDNLIPEGWVADGLDIDAEVDLDADLDVDVDMAPGSIDSDISHDPSGVGEISSASALSTVLGWLAVGRVPLLILLVILLTLFGLSGLLLQGLVSAVGGFLIPAWMAWMPALVLALPLTSLSARGIARMMPKIETSAVSSDSFVGRVAKVTLGEAKVGQPAQARLTDSHGKMHYVMVEPDHPEGLFAAGAQVLLVARNGALFKAIENTNEALVDEP